MKKQLAILFVFLVFSLIATPAHSQTAEEVAADSTEVAAPDYVLIAEQMPSFEGGGVFDFINWVSSNVEYPLQLLENKIDGTVIVSFIVNNDGALSDIEEVVSDNKWLTDVVMKTMARSPRWQPGQNNGEPVRVKFTTPIKFDLSGLSDKEWEEAVKMSKRALLEKILSNPNATVEDSEKYLGQMPIFKKKGYEEFRTWVYQRIEYPPLALENDIEGTVVIVFIVEKDGSISNLEAWGGHRILAEASLRVVASAPNWKRAGVKDGEPVRVRFSIPIHFKIPYSY